LTGLPSVSLSLIRLQVVSVALLASLTVSQNASSDDVGKEGVTGDWGGYRTKLEQAGIDLGFNYTSEVAYNARGGSNDLVRYADQLAFSSEFNLDRLIDVHDAEFKLTITKRNGRNLSNDAQLGTLQEVQEIYGRGQTWRLTQFWYDQKYFSEKLDLKVGRLTMGEDFAAFSCEFQNLTFCGSQPGNIVGNYWHNWPVSQWATRAKITIDTDVSLQVGAYEVNPHALDETDAMLPIFPGGTTGLMVPFELEWKPQVGAAGLPGSYKIGAWYDTSKADDVFDDIHDDPAVLTGLQPRRRHGRYGAYVNFRQQVLRFDAGDAARGLTLFFNASFADRRTSTIDNQVVLGMISTGSFDLRPRDEIGLAVGRTHVNDRVAQGQRLSNDGNPGIVQNAEYAVEFYYGLQATDWLMMRPNLQFVRQPGGTSHNEDVLVVGLKTSMDF